MVFYTIQQRFQWVFSKKCLQKISFNKMAHMKTPNKKTIIQRFQQSGSIEVQSTEKYSRNGRSQDNIDMIHLKIINYLPS